MSSFFSRFFSKNYQEQNDIPLTEISPGAPRPTEDQASGEEEAAKQEIVQWSGRWSFIMAAIGAAVGVGNFWRFPYLTYKHGGGVFLIPYFLSLLFIGIPLLLLELSLGQHLKKGVLGAFSTLHPKYQGIGLSSAYNSLVTMIYYTVVLAWTLVYLEKSFEMPLPWKDDPAQEFADTLNMSDSIDECSGLSWQVLIGLFVAWVITFGCIYEGIKGLSKIVWITVPLPYFLLIILFFRGISLPGAGDGIKEYLNPHFDKLFSSFDIWRDSATQILYSTGPTFGVMIAYANHVDNSQNLFHNTLIIALTNAMTSFVSGFVVWSVLGYMAQDQGVPIQELTNISGPGLAYIAFPEALALMPGSNILSVIFFIMVFLLGVDTTFSFVEVINHVIGDLTSFRFSNALVSLAVCACAAFFGLIFTLDNGIYLLDVVDHYLASFSLLTVALCEVVAVGYLYGPYKFLNEVVEALPENSNLNNRYVRICWTYGTGLLVGFLLGFEVIHEFVEPYSYGGDSELEPYPGWAQFFGWILGLVPVVLISVGWYRGREQENLLFLRQQNQKQQQQEQQQEEHHTEETLQVTEQPPHPSQVQQTKPKADQEIPLND